MEWVKQGEQSEERSDTTPSAATRRGFLSAIGVGGAALAGVGLGAPAVTAQEDGPPSRGDWSLAFEDEFESGELDDSKWDVGWGFGQESTTSQTYMSEESIRVEDGRLRLVGTHDGDDLRSGAVNTRETMTFGPGTYLEARIEFARRVGFHPAFWAKPTEHSWWPPEIDVTEALQNGSGRDDTHLTRQFLHYPQSTEPGDASTRKRLKAHSDPGDDITENFHVYGAEWRSNGITMYVDGEPVKTFTGGAMLTSMEKGAPFYVNLDQNIYIDSPLAKWVGTADLSEEWGEETVVDWVRAWKL